jgi:cell division control protein 6
MSDGLWDRGSIFKNEGVLDESYTPDKMPERQSEREQIIRGLGPAFNEGTPKNMFLQGRSGQGKTAIARKMLDEFEQRASKREVDVATFFLPCANTSSSYHLACNFVKEQTGSSPNGRDKRLVFNRMYTVLEEQANISVLVLDEVDHIQDEDEGLLYDIPRARDNGHISGSARISIIGISNDSSFLTTLSSKARDSLAERVINFDAYGADELRPILKRRVEKAFVDGAVSEGAISLCAAYAAQDKGSARQAIDYLYEAGDIALDNSADTVTDDHVMQAEERVDRRHVDTSIRGLTLQDRFTLAALVGLESAGETPARTRKVYREYQHYAAQDGNEIAFDRVRLHLKELQTMGIVDSQKRSGGGMGGEKYYWLLDTGVDATRETLEREMKNQSDVSDINLSTAYTVNP